MNKLIDFILSKEECFISAHVLYIELKIQTNFEAWIKREIKELYLKEGKDYFKIEYPTNYSKNNTDYALTKYALQEIVLTSISELGNIARNILIKHEEEMVEKCKHMDELYLNEEERKHLEEFKIQHNKICETFPFFGKI